MALFRTPLSRARGLGSAHHGASHWIGEQISSIALAPLSLWVVFSAIRLAGRDYRDVLVWLGSPINASLACLLAIASFIHMHAGMKVIVEDYVHTHGNKTILLLLNFLICALLAALALISILKVALTGGF